MRNAFADELTRLGDEDSRIVMLSGDIGNRLFDKFKARHPARFFNCGVAEANMMGVAAGMGINGGTSCAASETDASRRPRPHTIAIRWQTMMREAGLFFLIAEPRWSDLLINQRL